MNIKKKLEEDLKWVEHQIGYYTSLENRVQLTELKVSILQALQKYEKNPLSVNTINAFIPKERIE